MRLISTLLALVALPILAAPGLSRADTHAAGVVKLRAVGADGASVFGSAVSIGPEKLATACHVIRRATMVEVYRQAERWVAQQSAGSLSHDICVVTVRGLNLPAAPVRRSADLEAGERVVAVGFEGGGDRLVSGTGIVEGLYPYDGGQVIRTSAAFDFGSSGGGLFDEAGNLVGLLAFKARNGKNLRFALPADWMHDGSPVASSFKPIDSSSKGEAFWARPKASQPQFLGVAVQESAVR